METKRICPSCQKTLPADVPLGLCPECLIRSGFETGGVPGDSMRRGFQPPSIEEIRRVFPQFEVIELVGHGGMGAVYKARQSALDRFVALKVLPPEIAEGPGFAERFNREARALARLSHPNIVAVHDYGRTDGLHYLVMEFVAGTNLRQVQRAGRLAPEQALQIVPQICDALQYAHRQGVVHRDIKPENILLDKEGRVTITDFGIAKIVGQPGEPGAITGAKDVVGTPHYMAPEQVERPQSVDHRADIYSLGVVFYEMLTGELPLGKFAPPSGKVQIDVRLDDVVLRTLEKEPERRYQHAAEVKTDVDTIASSPGSRPLPLKTEANRRSIGPPAIGLIVTGSVNLLTMGLVVMAMALAIWAVQAGVDLEGVLNWLPDLLYAPSFRPARLSFVIGLFVWSALGGLMVAGGLHMLRLQGRALCIVAAVAAMFVAPGAYIGLPMGVWALIVLNRPEVRRAFSGAPFFNRTVLQWTLGALAAPVIVTLLLAFTPAEDPRLSKALATQQERILATVPPVVIATVPESGAKGVDPATGELRVTFSKPMQDRTWSWSTWGEENFPEIAGTPHYEADGRTCVLPVKLVPGKVYAIWLNSDSFKNFMDTNALPALPHLLIFETKH